MLMMTMVFIRGFSVTADAIFSGITTFAKLPWVQCLTKEKDVPFDIAFLGAPFVSHWTRCIPTHLRVG